MREFLTASSPCSKAITCTLDRGKKFSITQCNFSAALNFLSCVFHAHFGYVPYFRSIKEYVFDFGELKNLTLNFLVRYFDNSTVFLLLHVHDCISFFSETGETNSGIDAVCPERC